MDTSVFMKTPHIQPALSRELQRAINSKNILSAKSKKRYIDALDKVDIEVEEERQSSLRQKAIQEIITSEVTYLNQLEIIMKFFVQPLKERELLPPDVFQLIFGDVETIYNVNTEMLEAMKANDNIAEAFLQLAPFLKLYSVYAYTFQRALAVLQEWRDRNSELNSFLGGQELNPEVNTKLISLLITPIQRVPRYRLLLQEVIAHTSGDHHEVAALQVALRQVEEAATHMNEHLREQDNMQKMLEVQRSLHGGQPKIVVPGRHLVKAGKLLKMSRKSTRAHVRYFLLFSDMLMYCKLRLSDPGRPNSLKCCCLLPLKQCTVETVISTGVFKVSCHQESLILCALNKEEGEEWILSLRGAVNQFHESRQTLRKDSSSRRPLRGAAALLRKSSSLTEMLQRRRARRKNCKGPVQIDENTGGCPSTTSCLTPQRRVLQDKSNTCDSVKKSGAAGSITGDTKDSLFPLRTELKSPAHSTRSRNSRGICRRLKKPLHLEFSITSDEDLGISYELHESPSSGSDSIFSFPTCNSSYTDVFSEVKGNAIPVSASDDEIKQSVSLVCKSNTPTPGKDMSIKNRLAVYICCCVYAS